MHASLSSTPPNRAYYEACAGRWACDLDFAITDRAAFRAARMSLVDRLNLLSMTWAPRLLGPFRLETSVDASAAERGEVIHRTRVSKWGMTLMHSVEHLSLDPNGRDLTMRVEMHMAPLLWRAQHFPPGPASVDASGYQADYQIPSFGTQMHQRGERSADGTTVTLTQEMTFARGVQVLRRVG